MILTFGSINADLVVPVPKLPQPGETVLGGSYELLPGGKGANQALAARRAGADVMLVGAVGRDDFAAIALASLRGEGVDTRLVRDVELPTGCALIMVSAAGENIIAVAPGANMGVRCDWVSEDLLDANTTLVAQLEVPPGETQALIRRVRETRRPMLCSIWRRRCRSISRCCRKSIFLLRTRARPRRCRPIRWGSPAGCGKGSW